MAKSQRNRRRNNRNKRRSLRRNQRGGGNGYSVSVEDGSIAGMPYYTGYDSRQAPLYVGGITNEVNAMPMIPDPESSQVPPITKGADYLVMSSEASGLTGAPLSELGRTQSGGSRKHSVVDKELHKLIKQLQNNRRKLRF